MSAASLQQLLASHGVAFQVALFVFVSTSLWMVELWVARGTAIGKWQHGGVNAAFILVALPVELLMTTLLAGVSQWAVSNDWGIIHFLPFQHVAWFRYVVLFFLLDFGDYLYHRVMHRIGFFWRFHLVHHTDPVLDVSTTVREHPGETFVRMGLLCLWTFLLGASFGVLVLRQTVETLANLLAHTSLRLPPRAARILGWLFITPNIHHVHHHPRQPFTDCNYGDVFSIWDRLCGTYCELREDQTEYGLDTHPHIAPSTPFLEIVALGFQDPAVSASAPRTPVLDGIAPVLVAETADEDA
jgi:sterol desaturase/sphingolipid hydroxylase (fatty acid hydroxylase superfamily)